MVTFLAAAEEARDIGINPWAVGAIVLVALALTIFGLMVFGKGREHS